MDKPEIEYPCRWSYRVIGSDESSIRAAAAEVMGQEEYGLRLSRSSSGGRYISLALEAEVATEEQRLSVYDRLCAHPAVVMVL